MDRVWHLVDGFGRSARRRAGRPQQIRDGGQNHNLLADGDFIRRSGRNLEFRICRQAASLRHRLVCSTQFGSAYGGQPEAWTAFFTPWNNFFLIVIVIWLQTGYSMVLFSAAIKGIPVEILEAARVDGASEIQTFFRIMLPQILGTIIAVSTTIVIFTLKIFDVVWVMTGGQYGTSVIATEFYRQYFTYNNNGIGSAIAVVLFIAVIPVMIYNLRQFAKTRGIPMKSKFINSLLVNGSLTLICLLWTIPTFGLLISSFQRSPGYQFIGLVDHFSTQGLGGGSKDHSWA